MTPIWWQHDAQTLRAAYTDHVCTPVDVLESCLARIHSVQPRLNAYTTLRVQAVRAEAQASAERYRQGRPLSPLDGIPLSVKDNLLTADMPTTWGSRGLLNHMPGTEELAVTRLRKAGALIVGKTNVPEFTLEGYTDNPLFGTTRNPWDTRLTPGGSSGGAAASVAAGCTPLALGTDGGGSIRRPAAHCGLVGFKPSLGTVARHEGLPSLLLDFEVVGLMARSVADVQAMLDIVGGPDACDAVSWAAQAARSEARQEQTLRVLYVPTLNHAPVDSRIAHRCAAAVEKLSALGHVVHRGDLPLDLAPMTAAWPAVSQIGLDQLFMQHPDWRDAASPRYRAMGEQGASRPGRELWQMLEQVTTLRRACAALFKHWDVIAMPATAAQPWPAQEAYPATIDGQAAGPRGHAVFTGWVNAAGLPALSLPTQPDSDGLPIGLQLVARHGGDDLLLRLAAAYATQAPWHGRWPPL